MKKTCKDCLSQVVHSTASNNCITFKYLLLSHILMMETMKLLPCSPAPGTPPVQRGSKSRHRRQFPIDCCRTPLHDPRCVSSCLLPAWVEFGVCRALAGEESIAPALAPGNLVGSQGAHTGLQPAPVTLICCSRTCTGWVTFWSDLKRKKTKFIWYWKSTACYIRVKCSKTLNQLTLRLSIFIPVKIKN